MLAVMEDFSGLEKLFAVCAAIGGVLFAVRLVLQFVGGDVDVDDVPDGDIDFDGDAGDAGDSDISFKVLSFQGFMSFFMMFGLVGLALTRQSGWPAGKALAGACVAGALSVWILKFIYDKAKTLQSSGTLHLKNAIGQEGEVYLNIPATGTGKARVNIQNHLKVFDAMSEGDVEIKTGERIKVVRIISDNVLVVEKIV
ncbi:MAG: NfeD family protein [Sedimentisphaerales bacterium]|nr:NfeD family protein [Sedimentisphaerales bacterium]